MLQDTDLLLVKLASFDLQRPWQGYDPIYYWIFYSKAHIASVCIYKRVPTHGHVMSIDGTANQW